MTTSRAPRSYRELLVDPRLGPFLGAAMVSNVGNWFHIVTSVIVVYELTGSAFVVGLISFSNVAAFLVLTPLAGSTTDRFPRREVLLLAQSGSVVVAAALAGAFLAGNGSTVVVLGASLLLGVGSFFSIPATLSVVPELVEEDLSAAITLNTMGINLARMVGPVVGSLVLASAGAGPAFAVNALSFLVFALVCRRLPTTSPTDSTDPTDPTRPSQPAADRRYRAAMTLVWHDRTLRLLMLCVVVVGVLLEPNTTLAAPLAESVGAGEAFVGTIVGAFGAGALLSGSLVRRTTVTGMPTTSAGFLKAAAGLAGVSMATAPWMVLAGFALLGAGYLAAISSLTTQIQLAAPDAVRGRVMALWSQLLLGVRPVSSLVLGGLTDLLSVRVSTWSLVGLSGVGWWLSARAHRATDTDTPEVGG